MNTLRSRRLCLSAGALAAMVTVLWGRPAWAFDELVDVSSGGVVPASVSVNGSAPIAATTDPARAGAISGSKWLTATGGTENSTLVFTVQFKLPECFENPTFGIALHADNEARDVRLNGTSLNPGNPPQLPGSPIANWKPPSSLYTTTNAALFLPGINTLTIDLRNEGDPSGLDYSAGATYDRCKEGVLKVCKVAGPGVAVGTEFTFTAGGEQLTVPAGAPPLGLCVKVRLFRVGTAVTVDEVVPTDFRVTDMVVVPADREVAGTKDLGAGAMTVTIGAGVTEVRLTNRAPGFVEVCKEGTTSAVSGQFQLSADGEAFSVRVGACTPPIQVPAGQVTVSETPRPGFELDHCVTFPVTALIGCAGSKATIEVASGGPETQTVATFVNRSTIASACDCTPIPVGTSGDSGSAGTAGSVGSTAGSASPIATAVGGPSPAAVAVGDSTCPPSNAELTMMLANGKISSDEFLAQRRMRHDCA